MSTKSTDLGGQTAFVSHSTRGPGRMVAEFWGQAGAKVALHYRHDRTKAEESVRKFKAQGSKGLLVRADFSDEAQLEMLADSLRRELGGLDFLCLNLAMRGETEAQKNWSEPLNLACKHLLPLKKAHQPPRVLLLLPDPAEGPWAETLGNEAVSLVKAAGIEPICLFVRRETDASWSPQTLTSLVSHL